MEVVLPSGTPCTTSIQNLAPCNTPFKERAIQQNGHIHCLNLKQEMLSRAPVPEVSDKTLKQESKNFFLILVINYVCSMAGEY